MIPFATPQNHEVINLLQIVRLTAGAAGTKDEGTVWITFSNGDESMYEGDAAKNINIEVKFALNMYRQWQISTQQTIITPGNEPGERFM